jgi:sugar phosphate isomerase/epimerase
MMGDGVIDLPKIRAWIEAAGYSGFHEVEIFSELDWGKKSPDQVLTIIKQRYRDCS